MFCFVWFFGVFFIFGDLGIFFAGFFVLFFFSPKCLEHVKDLGNGNCFRLASLCDILA